MALNSQLQEFTEEFIEEYSSFEHPENIHHQRTLKQHSYCIHSLATLIRDGTKYFVSSSHDKRIKMWNATDKRCEATLTSLSAILSLETFVIDGHNYIACGGYQGRGYDGRGVQYGYSIEIWDVKTKTCIKNLKGHSKSICALLSFQMNIPKGEKLYLASGSRDMTIQIWGLSTYHCIATLRGHSNSVNGLSTYEMYGNFFLVSASGDKTIKIWDLKQMNEVATLTGHSDWVRTVITYYNEGRIHLASGSDDKTIKLWDLTTREVVSTLDGHAHWVKSLAIFESGENTCLASGSRDKTIKLWNLTDNTLITTLLEINSEVDSLLTFHDDENEKSYLISGHDNGEIMMWSE